MNTEELKGNYVRANITLEYISHPRLLRGASFPLRTIVIACWVSEGEQYDEKGRRCFPRTETAQFQTTAGTWGPSPSGQLCLPCSPPCCLTSLLHVNSATLLPVLNKNTLRLLYPRPSYGGSNYSPWEDYQRYQFQPYDLRKHWDMHPTEAQDIVSAFDTKAISSPYM